MADERRVHERIPLRQATEVRFTSWQMYSLIYSINISQGGMSLELPAAQKPGDRLHVRITPPKGTPVEVEAEVRHCTAHGKQFTVGVQFLDLDDAKKQGIEQSIRAAGATMTPSLKRVIK
jgi:hypothetical protein